MQIGFLRFVNDRVCHGSDETEPFVAHDFGNEMRVHAAHAFGDRTQKVHVQPAGREFQDVLESLFLNRAKQVGSAAEAIAECG